MKQFTQSILIKKTGFFFLVLIALTSFRNPSDPKNQINDLNVEIQINRTLNKIKVSIEVRHPDNDSLMFCFPKSIPGTYEMNYFGRFVTDFRCCEDNGNELKSIKKDSTNFLIPESKRLSRITYQINLALEKKEKNMNPMTCGKTVIKEDFLLLNFQSIVGYFKGHENYSYRLNINKFSGFYGNTSLPEENSTDSMNRYIASNYYELIDSPIAYSVPDTFSFQKGKARMIVSVFSDNHIITSDKLKNAFQKMFTIVCDKFGDVYDGDYHVIVYGEDVLMPKLVMGALEHKNSTVMVIDEYLFNEFTQVFRYHFIDWGIARIFLHELLHKLTPIGIHPKEMDKFNFETPFASKHMWLYESVIEYITHKLYFEADSIYREPYFQAPSVALNYLKQIKTNLIKESEKAFQKGSNACMDYYMTAPVIMYIFDVDIYKNSNGQKDIVSELKAWHNEYKDQLFAEDSLFHILRLKTGDSAVDHLMNNLTSYKTFDLSYWINDFGYEQKKGQFLIYTNTCADTSYYISSIGILSTEIESGKVNAQFYAGSEIYGFKPGTKFIIEKINNQPLTNLLINDCFVRKSRKIVDFEISIIVGKVHKTIKIKPNKRINTSDKYCIVKKSDASEKEKLNFERFYKTSW
jgi:predicted metalloprotease with PDZ domain